MFKILNIMNRILLILIFFYCLVFITTAQNGSWVILGDTVNGLNVTGNIEAIVVDDTGYVYAAGGFTDASGNYYVSKWNGSTWSALGSGSNALHANGIILTIALDLKGNLYAGGFFTTPDKLSYVAKWNGQTWSMLGNTIPFQYGTRPITSIITDNVDNVYVAGIVDSSGNPLISKWDGTKWSKLGADSSGIFAYPDNEGTQIMSIVFDKNYNLYAAGDLQNDGQYFVVKWNDTTWSEAGVGSNALNATNYILSMATDPSGNLYAGGYFTDLSSQYYVAKWDGTKWSELGGGISSLGGTYSIYAVTTDVFGNVYASGDFYDDTTDTYFVAKWDGTRWSKLEGAANSFNDILALATDHSGNIYASNIPGPNNTNNVAIWTPTTTSITTSIQPLQVTNISVYPNPGSGIVHISDLSENVQLNVYSITGTYVSTQPLPKGSSSMDLSGLSPGMYTLVFAGQTTSYTPMKWVKE